MGTIEVAEMLKSLQSERAHALQEVTKLDRAIASLRELSTADSTPSKNGRSHKLSAAARERIAAAQRARWAKVRKEQKAKA
jgi:hypothetical protein